MKNITPTIRDLVTALMNKGCSRTDICYRLGCSNGHLYRLEKFNNAKSTTREVLQIMLKEKEMEDTLDFQKTDPPLKFCRGVK